MQVWCKLLSESVEVSRSTATMLLFCTGSHEKIFENLYTTRHLVDKFRYYIEIKAK